MADADGTVPSDHHSGKPCGDRTVNWGGCAAVLALTGLGLALRLYRLEEVSVSSDDYMNFSFLGGPLFDGYIPQRRFFAPDHLPFYFLVQYAWVWLFGASAWSIRMLSVSLGAATVPLVYAVARLFSGRRASLLAALLTAVSPFHLIYARIMCYNAMFEVMGLLSLYGLLCAARGGGRRWWTLNLANNILMVFTHIMATLLWFAQGLFLLASSRFAGKRRFKVFLWWSLPQVISLVVPLAWLYPQFPYVAAPGEDAFEVHPATVLVDTFADDAIALSQPWLFWTSHRSPEISDPYDGFRRGTTLDGWMNRALAAFVVICVTWLILRAARRARAQDSVPPDWSLLLFLALVPVLVLALLSYVVRPCLQAQYTPYGSHALYIVTGAALAAIPQPWFRRAAISGLLLIYGYQLSLVLPGSMGVDWASAARLLEAEANQDDLILVRGRIYSTDNFRANAPKLRTEVLPAYSLQSICRKSARFLNTYGAADPQRTVWAVIVVMYDYPPLPMERFEAMLHAQGLVFTKRFFPGMGGLALYEIQRSPHPPAREDVVLSDCWPGSTQTAGLLPRELAEALTPEERAALPWFLGNQPPAGAISWSLAAIAAADEGFPELAERFAHAAIASRPNCALGYFALAISLWEQDAVEAAMTAYATALDLDRVRFFQLYADLLDGLYVGSAASAAGTALARLDKLGAWVPEVLRMRAGGSRFAAELQGARWNRVPRE